MDTPARMKYEQSPVTSPADSYVSTSGCPYPPLSDNVMNSTEMLTPRSFDDESHFGSSISGTPAPDVKPVKKRKSWGQQLPEPKTNLPPRKRAKTEDEKEQRRVERVLRNRRAAQSSRERKRLEVEALEAEKRAIERKNSDLVMRLADIEAKYRLLEQEFERIGGTRSSFGSYSLPTPNSTALRQSSPITFSPVVNLQEPATVNPVCLSPEIRPVYNPSAEFSFDMTQHPAAMLCDLQCQSEETRRWRNTTTPASTVIMQILATNYLMANLEAYSKLSRKQISSVSKKKPALLSKHSILNSITWMVATTACLMNSFFSTISMKNLLRMIFSVRISWTIDLPACSLNLARPLLDATMEELRPVSNQLTCRHYSSVEASPRECHLRLEILRIALRRKNGSERDIYWGKYSEILTWGTLILLRTIGTIFGRGFNSMGSVVEWVESACYSKTEKRSWGKMYDRLQKYSWLFPIVGVGNHIKT